MKRDLFVAIRAEAERAGVPEAKDAPRIADAAPVAEKVTLF
jgi:hypothetical protein